MNIVSFKFLDADIQRLGHATRGRNRYLSYTLPRHWTSLTLHPRVTILGGDRRPESILSRDCRAMSLDCSSFQPNTFFINAPSVFDEPFNGMETFSIEIHDAFVSASYIDDHAHAMFRVFDFNSSAYWDLAELSVDSEYVVSNDLIGQTLIASSTIVHVKFETNLVMGLPQSNLTFLFDIASDCGSSGFGLYKDTTKIKVLRHPFKEACVQKPKLTWLSNSSFSITDFVNESLECISLNRSYFDFELEGVAMKPSEPEFVNVQIHAYDQLILEQCSHVTVTAAANHKVISMYSVVSVALYTIAFIASILVIRMHGISFTRTSFLTDLMSLTILLSFGILVLNNVLWITVVLKSEAPVAVMYYITQLLLYCINWSTILAVCFHWASVLKLTVRRVPTRTVVLLFLLLNMAFYGVIIWIFVRGFDFFQCVYTEYLLNPHYDYNPCAPAYCPDLQPSQWYEATITVCRDYDFAQVFFTSFTFFFITFSIATIVLLVLGLSVLLKGERLLNDPERFETKQVYRKIRQALYTYIGMVCFVCIVILIQGILVLVLYTSNKLIPATVYYTFVVWLPLVVPSSGFLLLQWNPALHGNTRESSNQVAMTPAAVRRSSILQHSRCSRWSCSSMVDESFISHQVHYDNDVKVIQEVYESQFTAQVSTQMIRLAQRQVKQAEKELSSFESTHKLTLNIAAGLYENLIDRLQDEEEIRVERDRLETNLNECRLYLDSLDVCRAEIYDMWVDSQVYDTICCDLSESLDPFSQILALVTTSFCHKLQIALARDPKWLNQMLSIGFLCHFDADLELNQCFRTAITSIHDKVTLILHPTCLLEQGVGKIRVEQDGTRFRVLVYVCTTLIPKFPVNPIRIQPVFFSQTSGNRRSWLRLRQYCQDYIQYSRGVDRDELPGRLHAIQTLQDTNRLGRELGAGRVSIGKGMIAQEHADILLEYHGISNQVV